MDKIKVQICTGTSCFVMGGSEILLLEEELPADLKDKVEIEGVNCLDKCKNAANGKAPFVMVNGKLISSATLSSVLEEIRSLV